MTDRQLQSIRNLFHDEGPMAVVTHVEQLINECERRGREIEDLRAKLEDHCRDERVLVSAGPYVTNWTRGAGR